MYLIVEGYSTPSNRIDPRNVITCTTDREVSEFFSSRDPKVWSVYEATKLKVTKTVEVEDA